MTVTTFHDLPLASRDHDWDGDAAEKRVREWAGAQDGPNAKTAMRTSGTTPSKKDNFTAYKLLITDVMDGRLKGRPPRPDGGWERDARRPAAASTCPKGDVDRVKSHLAKYYEKMGDSPPWRD